MIKRLSLEVVPIRVFKTRVKCQLIYAKCIKILASLLFSLSGAELTQCSKANSTAITGFLLVGVGVSSVVPLVYSAAGKSNIFSPGVALAAVSTIGFLGFLIGPPLIGIVAGFSSLQVSFSLIALMGLMIVTLAAKMISV